MDEDLPESKVAYLRGVAETLRGIADKYPYEPRRRNQLFALADGFDRFADRVEREAQVSD